MPARGTGKAQRYLEDVVIPYQGDDCLEWPFCRNGNGYGIIAKGRGIAPRTVANAVCERVYGPAPKGKMARHLCGRGNKGCATPNHLTWGTAVENAEDRVKHGTHARGERNAMHRLTEMEADAIRLSTGHVEDVAQQYGCSIWTVYDIRSGRRRKHG